jgi:putative two-component system response regulator
VNERILIVDDEGRVGAYSALVAWRLGLDDRHCDLIRRASSLHDVGKIGVADEILLKPGPLTAPERTAMQRHAEIGHDILAGSGLELLELAATIAWTHHERVDGTGYPRGLVGDEIPLEGRIVAVVDVYDALTSDRPYRSAFTAEEALDLLRSGRGTQFDPDVLGAFFATIARSPAEVLV